MNFKDLMRDNMNEALDITKKGADGFSAQDMLVAFFNAFGDKPWTTKEGTPIRKQFGKRAAKFNGNLIHIGFIDDNKAAKTKQLTQAALDYIKKNGLSDEDIDDLEGAEAKGVKDITKLKAKKFIVPKVGSNSKYLDQMKKILFHMNGFAKGTLKTTYMLAGDPGTGKTSFIKSLSTLTGIPLVIIEAPHITQEHLINIPFIVLDGPKRHEGQITIDDSPQGMKVVQAESNLVTQLKSKRKRTEDQIQKEINKNKVLRDIQPKLGAILGNLRKSYNSILFLDEFYRTSSMKIRNVLRNILNGKIGNDKIPKGVYIIMATNIDDEGVDDIPLNQDFHLMDYDISSKDDFMNYMFGKYVGYDENAEGEEIEDSESETGINVKMDVWNKFMEELTDGMLGFNDENSDTRLSPRRLEQMIISIDNLLPAKDYEDALQIIAFVRNNLVNYLNRTGNQDLIDKFMEIAYDLISTYNDDIDIEKLKNMPIRDSEWRKQLQTEVKLKLELGENRKYIPVVSGQPGIGKTTEMKIMAKDMEMGFIHVDCANLVPEDITGMPIANMGDDTITTDFSEPNLYITIMKEYNEIIDQHRVEGRKYNIVLMFDELNRASVPVFNAIRKVLLEKEFEHVKLPEDIIVTSAINPTDEGTFELTSHTRDVLDIIPGSGNFSATIDYIIKNDKLVPISEALGFNIAEAVGNVMASLATEFKSDNDRDGNTINDPSIKPFYWQDGSSVFYVSPREMTEACMNACVQIEGSLMMMNYNVDADYNNEEYDLFIEDALNTLAKSFVDSLNNTLLKQQIEGFSRILGMRIISSEKYKKLFETIRTKKSANVMNLVQIFDSADGDINFLDKSVIGSYISDFTSTEMVQDVAVITDRWMDSGIDVVEKLDKMGSLFDRINKSLEKLNASNQYNDQLKKYIGSKITNLLEGDEYDIFQLADNEALMNKLGVLL